jgi:sigma-B regulation protein RsbU (phosphoserine phosphatase)
MLLSTRIALFVSLAFVLAFGSLAIVGLQRETLAARPYTRIAIAGQEALWREILVAETRRLSVLREQIAADTAISDALQAGDLPTLRRLAVNRTRHWLASGELSDLQILDRQGQILFSSAIQAEPARLLDISTIGAILGGGGEPAGIRQVSTDGFRVVSAQRYAQRNGDATVLALAAAASRPLERFAIAMNADSYLVSTRGRLVEGTQPDLWQNLGLSFPQRVGSVQQAALGDRLYAATAIPLADISAGSAGLLVTVQDATESLLALDRLTALTVAIMAAVAVLTVGGLYLYLRYSFAPLRRAVAILGALARGDTSAALTRQSDDEIGEIASAITELRRNLVALNDARRQRELQRRRQERFVRHQMVSLAETLEPGARDEVLSDLGRIVAASKGSGDSTTETADVTSRLIREDDQLGPIAAVLQQMSGRVVEQHRRLSELVARLREALVRETQLATLQQELAIARDLQRSVLPADFPARPTFAVKGLMQSANEVGGDFYDFFERSDGRLVFVIADVSGKGVPAAFFMAISRTLLKAIALFESDPAVCVRQLNDLLVVDNDQMMFVTLVFGVFDPKSGRIDFVNAGHSAPIRVAPDGAVTALPQTTDMAVAVDTTEFSSHSLELSPGEMIVLYTDGVTEAFNPEGDQFGEQRLQESLQAIRNGNGPDGVARGVLSAVKGFENGGHQSDDITLLVLHYTGTAA